MKSISGYLSSWCGVPVSAVIMDVARPDGGWRRSLVDRIEGASGGFSAAARREVNKVEVRRSRIVAHVRDD